MKLELSAVSRAFGTHKALDQLTLSVQSVQTLVLIGPSGGGKSTLLRVLAGLETPDSGQIVLNDCPLIFEEKALLQHRRSTGVVFQSFNLFPHLSALENITLPLKVVQKKSRAEADHIALELLRQFQLENHSHKKPAALSGGQRQRIAIARALAVRPKLLILDEPTSALDPAMTGEVLDTLTLLREQGRDFILATHEMGFARRIADRVALIAEGQVVEEGATDTLFDSPSSPMTKEFFSRVFPN
jgi:polar amino acid transport system ATP-binding protein